MCILYFLNSNNLNDGEHDNEDHSCEGEHDDGCKNENDEYKGRGQGCE